ncbi:SDR family NAD(P)-dependent oxidoreductase [Rheinheimera baltica]|uniref:SDR family NAD(P)-dependent oxidoreductase n=1 Tax=Rheinheimera baltica TaxID=67576 RepID=UPI0003FFE145|nr:SDR family NAD(P)-dependent oxidoreductase [Rheinheimera baltica]
MQVLVTGATGGIGFAIASHFAALGHNVVLADLQQDAINSKVALLIAQGFSASGLVLDVTNAESIASAAEQYQIDILVKSW